MCEFCTCQFFFPLRSKFSFYSHDAHLSFCPILFQVHLRTLYQHTRGQRSCFSLWERSLSLGFTQLCPPQDLGKLISNSTNTCSHCIAACFYENICLAYSNAQWVLQVGKSMKTEFGLKGFNLYLNLLSFRPEGTRMIQVMLLKSLVQVCLQIWIFINKSVKLWVQRRVYEHRRWWSTVQF